MAKGAQLSVEVQTFIVQALACFDFPSVVVKAVKEEFGLTLTRQRVEGYDPTKRAGQALSQRWRLLFEATRKAFVEDTSTIAISHRSARLRTLQRMAAKAEDMGNMALAGSLLEQAAKEMGNAFTNTRVLTGPNGSPLIPKAIVPEMSPAEAAEAYADTLNAAGG